ncbi:MAG: ArsR family transcriptional regulator, partial [Proteobacteria bacterium]|nr:ArsR family transcriptional regulator [Pseudomonadota bacterium]
MGPTEDVDNNLINVYINLITVDNSASRPLKTVTIARNKTRKTKELRQFILEHVSKNSQGIGTQTAQAFGISRQAVSRHLHEMVEEGLLTASGKTKARTYALNKIVGQTFAFNVTKDTAEDVIWIESIRPLLMDLKKNVLDICEHGFTEMVNNVVSHSDSKYLAVSVERTALDTTITVLDTGVGIFNKIKNDFNLHDPRHAILELCKGKFTSDPVHHSGEGIFFTSKMFDRFSIFSGSLFFSSSTGDDEAWLIETEHDAKIKYLEGTSVFMKIGESSNRVAKEVFDTYASEDANWDFSKTHIVLKLL